MDKPDVDFIEGLSPAISIDQKSASRNPRSTVGTITEVYDYLRLLFARIGVPTARTTATAHRRQTPQQIVDRVLELPEGTRFQVLAPVVRGRKGTYETLLEDLAKQGFARARIDGELTSSGRHTSSSARYESTPSRWSSTASSCATASSALTDSPRDRAAPRRRRRRDRDRAPEDDPRSETLTFSQHLACPSDGMSFEELAPRNFSFNSPYGACPAATASAPASRSTPSWSSPTPTCRLAEGAIAPWAGGTPSTSTACSSRCATESDIEPARRGRS
jgi:excinuclease ABC subunit A